MITAALDRPCGYEKLLDGRGYELIETVTSRGSSLFVGINLSTKCLRLPAVDHGKTVLGASAIDYDVLERELEDVLGNRSPSAKRRSRWEPPLPPAVLDRSTSEA